MASLEIILLLLSAVYIAWGIGANDETMMIVASGSSLSINRLVLIGAIVTLIGAIAYGQIVEETIGKGILTIQATDRIALIIVAATASWLTIVSWFGWPVSTSHSTVGAVIGYGIFAGGPQNINWEGCNKVFLGWLFSPLIGFAACYIIAKPLTKNITNEDEHELPKRWLYSLLLGALLQEFWQGANNISSSTAFLNATFEFPMAARILAGVSLAIGLLMLGRRVLTAAGLRITRLPVRAALVAQIVIVAINAVGTLYGLPLSGTHLSVGCLVGAGLASKTKIDFKMFRNVLLYWLLTLPGAALSTIVVASIAKIIIP